MEMLSSPITTVVLLVLIGIASYVYYLQKRPKRSPYREGDPRYLKEFSVHRKDTNYTLSNFTSYHQLELFCRRVNNEDFNLHEMLKSGSQNMLAMSFNTNRVRRIMYKNSWYFHYELAPAANGGYAPRLVTREYAVKGDTVLVREVSNKELITKVNKEGFRHGGCEAELISIEPDIFSEGIIEGNFDMLKEEHLNAVLRDELYGQYEELVAVAALKCRLKFLGNKSESYRAEWFTIETEKAGRALKIRWQIDEAAKRDYELIGFRKTDGFCSDPFSEINNGKMVIHGKNDGEVTELLNEGEANFYTLFLRQPQRGSVDRKCSPLRFQITIACREETAELESIMARAKERNSDPDKERISRAIKELGIFVELDAALESKTKAWEKKIRDNDEYSAEQKEEKVGRLVETMKLIRSNYEP
jgi:hypothetical protein